MIILNLTTPSHSIWKASKYINLNKVQISIQNIDRTDKQLSNACYYNHPYSVAIALMGCPVFFQETHYYSDEAREQIRSFLNIYKQVRHEMFKGFVFPIGDKPNDKNWTGFQNHNPENDSGYLLIFRELNNEDKNKDISLHFISEKRIRMKNLISGDSFTVKSDNQGKINITIENPAEFLYLKYEMF